MARGKLIIGWREWVRFPDLGGAVIKAKIDTGAKTSALHAYRIKKEMRDGVPWASFRVHPMQRHRHPEIQCSAPIVDEREIRSSNGHTEVRFVVKTPLKIGPYTHPVELTLTNRDEMGFRVLIGRQALKKFYIVDSSLSYGTGHLDQSAIHGTLPDEESN